MSLSYTRRICSPPLSLAIDFKNGADKQFGRKLFDCESNGVRRQGKSSVPKSLTRVFATPRWKQLRLAAVVERDHSLLRSGLFA